MLAMVIKYKKEIRRIQHLLPENISKSEWQTLKRVYKVLRPCHTLTVQLQDADITPTDALLKWKACIIKLKNIGTLIMCLLISNW